MLDLLSQFSNYLSENGYAQRTVNGYCSDIRQYMRWVKDAFPEIESQKIDVLIQRETVEGYLNGMKAAGTAPATLNRLLAALGAFEQFCGSPTAGQVKEIPRMEHTPTTILDATRKDLRALLKEFHRQRSASRTARQTWHATRNWAILQVLRESGLRAGKVCMLRVESDAGKLDAVVLKEIFPGVEFSPTARQALMDWLVARTPGPGWLFSSYSGKPLQPCDLYRMLRTLGDRANVHVTPEMLR